MDLAHQSSFQKVKIRSHRFLFPVLILLGCLSCFPRHVYAQQRVLDVGIRVQKSINLYYENGLTLQYSSEALASERLYLGLSYVSSRLGTAIGSHAIRQDNFLFSTSFFFRPKRLIRPIIRANIGYFTAALDPVFDDLPQSSLLLSSEGGVCLDPKNPFKITASLGYNLITGDGSTGPGTLYPVFVQTSLSWDVFHKTGKRK